MPSIARVEGIPELLRKLQAEPLLRKPLRRVLSRFGTQGKQAAKSVAPTLTGALRSSITSRLDSKPMPRFVSVRTKARSPQGFGYPRLLEYSTKHGHKGWLAGALHRVVTSLPGYLADAAKDIEAGFGRK